MAFSFCFSNYIDVELEKLNWNAVNDGNSPVNLESLVYQLVPVLHPHPAKYKNCVSETPTAETGLTQPGFGQIEFMNSAPDKDV